MRYLSILFLFFSCVLFSASDQGSITVSGETIEVSVERIYSPAADYPRSALRRGTEGYVVIEFDVSPEGEVVDPYVVEADQPGYFERTVMRTIRRWAYEPYVYNGVPATVNDVTARFTFKLAEE
jgi:protein TonB